MLEYFNAYTAVDSVLVPTLKIKINIGKYKLMPQILLDDNDELLSI